MTMHKTTPADDSKTFLRQETETVRAILIQDGYGKTVGYESTISQQPFVCDVNPLTYGTSSVLTIRHSPLTITYTVSQHMDGSRERSITVRNETLHSMLMQAAFRNNTDSSHALSVLEAVISDYCSTLDPDMMNCTPHPVTLYSVECDHPGCHNTFTEPEWENTRFEDLNDIIETNDNMDSDLQWLLNFNGRNYCHEHWYVDSEGENHEGIRADHPLQ